MEYKVHKSGFIKHSVEVGEFSGDVPYFVFSKLGSNYLRFVQILVRYSGIPNVDAVDLFGQLKLKEKKQTIWGILSKAMANNQIHVNVPIGKFFVDYALYVRFTYSDNVKTIAMLKVYNKREEHEFEFIIFHHNLKSLFDIWGNKLPSDLYSSITSVLVNSDINEVVKDKLLENVYNTSLNFQRQSKFNKYIVRSAIPESALRVFNGK